jgi:two-component system sensor histidine kinase BaeS
MVDPASSLSECLRQLKLRDRFLAWVVHELRAPLTALSGSVQLQGRLFSSIQRQPEVSMADVQLRLQVYLDYSLGQLRRMENQVRNLSDLLQIQEGELDLHTVETDLCPLLTQLIEQELSLPAEGLGVVIDLDLPVTATMSLDPLRTREAITHLLESSMKRSQGGGVIRVSLKRDDQENWVLRVQDPGRRLSSEELLNLFDPYGAGESGEHSRGELNLGPYLARGLLRAQGAELQFTEAEVGSSGWGNEVCVRFNRDLRVPKPQEPESISATAF